MNIELVSSPGGSPGGFSGDIQYNNGGVLGGSAATVDALGNIVALTLTSTTVTSTAFDFLGVLVDTTGTVGASGQFLETTSTGVKWATVAAGGSTWAALTGDMTSTQVAPWDGPTPGTPDTGLSRVARWSGSELAPVRIHEHRTASLLACTSSLCRLIESEVPIGGT